MSFLWFSKTSQKTCKNVPLNSTRSTNVIPLSLLLLDGHRRYCPLLSSSAVPCSTHRYKSNKIQVKVAFFPYHFSLSWLRFSLRVFIFFYIVLRLGFGILFKHTQKVAGWAASFSRLTWCVSGPGWDAVGCETRAQPLSLHTQAALLSPLLHLQC